MAEPRESTSSENADDAREAGRALAEDVLAAVDLIALDFPSPLAVVRPLILAAFREALAEHGR